jgi:hypothetical protein
MGTIPVIKVYKACDDSGYATVYLDGKGKPLPVVHFCSSDSEVEARDAAIGWWLDERAKQRARKPAFTREPKVVPGVTHDVEEDPFA